MTVKIQKKRNKNLTDVILEITPSCYLYWRLLLGNDVAGLILFLFFLSVGISPTLAQRAKIDSLLALSKQAQVDADRISLYNQLSRNYTRISPDSAKIYGQLAWQIAQQVGDQSGMAIAQNNLGGASFMLGDYTTAEQHWKTAMQFNTLLNDSLQLASNIGNLGLVAERQGDLLKALEYHHHSLLIKERAKADAEQIAIAYNNIGIVYEKVEDYDWAIQYHTRALRIRDSLQLLPGLSSSYMNLAIAHDRAGEKNAAKPYYYRALALKKQLNDEWGNANCLIALGLLLMDTHQPDSAKWCFSEASTIAGLIRAENIRAYSLIGMASIAILEKDMETALTYARSAQEILKDQISLEELKEIKSIYYQYHYSKGDMQRAFDALLEYHQLTDSLYSEQRRKEMGLLEVRYAFEKGKNIQLKEQVKQEATLRQIIARHEVLQWGGLLFIAVLSITGLFLFRAYQLLKWKNSELEAQKQQISYLNNHLEEMVADRTSQLVKRNEQLSEYAFLNAHRVRGPLSRMLGLAKGFENGLFIAPEDHRFAMKALKDTANEMDQIIQEINDKLGE